MTLKRSAIAVTAAAATAVLGAVSPAYAAPAGPVAAGLTITPSVTTVGGQVTVVATATNTTSAPVGASLGIENPDYANQKFTAVHGTAGCTPRNLHRLIYCGIQSLAPGATASITVNLTATAPGTDSLRSYARITYTTGDTFASATLTVQ